MYQSTIAVILLAFYCSEAVGRLNKRNGYPYKVLSSAPHSSYYEPSAHEPPSGEGHAQSPTGKYEDGSYYEYQVPSSGKLASSSGGGGKLGYSIGSGLRSIAQGSANQAYTAVASQHAAAKQAAFIAKNTLAQAASQAAATAQTALAGKQVILQELEQQAAEAQRSLSRELEQLNAARIAAKLAQKTAQAAHSHISVLTAAVNNAKHVAEQAEQTSNEVANQLASQSSMVGRAKNRLEQVDGQVQQARIDYEATKEAANKASSSAAEAQVNASQAAAHATIGLHESTKQSGGASQHDDVAYDDEHGDTTAIGHTAEGHP